MPARGFSRARPPSGSGTASSRTIIRNCAIVGARTAIPELIDHSQNGHAQPVENEGEIDCHIPQQGSTPPAGSHLWRAPARGIPSARAQRSAPRSRKKANPPVKARNTSAGIASAATRIRVARLLIGRPSSCRQSAWSTQRRHSPLQRPRRTPPLWPEASGSREPNQGRARGTPHRSRCKQPYRQGSC